MSKPTAKSRSEASPARSTQRDSHGPAQAFLVGIDVGSTTVKAVVCSKPGGEPLFRDYRRHESRQAETVLDVLHRAKCELGMADSAMRLFMTGSGGQQLAQILSARFVQEVALRYRAWRSGRQDDSVPGWQRRRQAQEDRDHE